MAAESPGTVVRGRLRPDLAPEMPSSRISRSTVHRATTSPFLFNSSHIFRAPVNLPPFLAFPHRHDLLFQHGIAGIPCRRTGLATLREIVRRHRKTQDRTGRLDAKPVPVRINEPD